MLLPEFRRGHGWNRDQVRGLMRSLHKGHPVGALPVWETEGGAQAVRGGATAAPGTGRRTRDHHYAYAHFYPTVTPDLRASRSSFVIMTHDGDQPQRMLVYRL